MSDATKALAVSAAAFILLIFALTFWSLPVCVELPGTEPAAEFAAYGPGAPLRGRIAARSVSICVTIRFFRWGASRKGGSGVPLVYGLAAQERT